jgi:iron complex outermembrane receptor protein
LQLTLYRQRAFRAGKVVAYEIGSRGEPAANVCLSISTFYNVYADLRSIGPAPGTFMPLKWGNSIEGDTYGVEAWANVQITAGWRLAPGVKWLHKDLRFSAGPSGFLGTAQAGDDPSTPASLKSSISDIR